MKSFAASLSCILVTIILFPALSGATAAEEDSLLQAKRHFSFAVQNKKNGDTGEAARQYEKSLSFCDTLYQVHFSFAELLMTMQLPERARGEYLRTLALNPSHFPSAAVLAGMYTTAARYDSALAMYETMYRLHPDATVLSNIAKLREYLGKNAEGFQAAQTLIEQGEDTPENLRLAADLAMKSGNNEAADGFILRALEKCPDDRELLRLGVKSSLALRDSSKAEERLFHLVERDSTDIAPLIELEDMRRSRGEGAGLIRALERHHRLSPRDVTVIGELAETCIAEGDYSRGEEWVRKGLLLTPKDGRLHIILGELYRVRGQKDRARTEYTVSLEDPKWAETARRCIDRLSQPRDETREKEKNFFGRGKTKTD